MLEDVTDVKMEVTRFYEESYLESNLTKPTLGSLRSSKRSVADNSFLTAPFMEEEIKKGVWVAMVASAQIRMVST